MTLSILNLQREFAVEASESYLSDINHDGRRKYDAMSQGLREQLESTQNSSLGYGYY